MIQIIYNKVSSMLVTNYCARCQTTSCISLEHTLSCCKRKESLTLKILYFFQICKKLLYNKNYNERKPQLRKYTMKQNLNFFVVFFLLANEKP